MSRQATIIACLMLVCSMAAHIGAQQPASSTLSGTVTDPQGCVIQGARLRVKQKSTGIEHDATTNSEGFYVLTNLAVGEYEVRAAATGFAEQHEVTLMLRIGQSATLNWA